VHCGESSFEVVVTTVLAIIGILAPLLAGLECVEPNEGRDPYSIGAHMKQHRIAITMIGSILACVLAGSAQAQANRSPAPRTGELDAKPYLAQGFAQGPEQAILLQRMQASCPKETKRALMLDRRAPLAWFGCWREKEGKVEIAFEDGDFLSLEHDKFVWLPETGT
jgi:hypothetical protein